MNTLTEAAVTSLKETISEAGEKAIQQEAVLADKLEKEAALKTEAAQQVKAAREAAQEKRDEERLRKLVKGAVLLQAKTSFQIEAKPERKTELSTLCSLSIRLDGLAPNKIAEHRKALLALIQDNENGF